MRYRVEQVINNNTVLAKSDRESEAVILISKGIGFAIKKGIVVSDEGRASQVYKLWMSGRQADGATYDAQLLQKTVSRFCSQVEQLTGIDGGRLCPTLVDHLLFAADRYSFGIEMENVLDKEIPILYATEYFLGKQCMEMIKAEIRLDLGDAEACFVAMHLRAALNNRPIKLEMQDAFAYAKVAELLEQWYPAAPKKGFLLSLHEMVEAIRLGKSIIFKMSFFDEDDKEVVTRANEIACIVENDLNIKMYQDVVGYIAADIERIRQIN